MVAGGAQQRPGLAWFRPSRPHIADFFPIFTCVTPTSACRISFENQTPLDPALDQLVPGEAASSAMCAPLFSISSSSKLLPTNQS